MSEWRDLTLGDVLTLQRGFDLPIQDRSVGCYPIVASTGVVGFHSAFQVKSPGVVIGRSGSIGGGQFIDEDFWPLNTTLWVKDFKGNDPRYCYYLLKSLDLAGFNAGSGVPTLNRNHIHPLPVCCPNLPTQKSISSLLGALDDKIELNRRMNETLEAVARAIFKNWFVDFGPTRAKMEGWAPYLTPKIWELFPERLDDEGKPEGWACVPLTNYSLLNPEAWSRDNTPHEIEYLDLASVKWGVIENTQRIPWSDAPSRAQRILRAGDTVVGTVRPGNGSYSLIGQHGLTGSTGFAALRPKKPTYREVVYLAATSSENIERLTHLADGAAYPAVRPDVVGATEVCRPSELALTAFSGICAPIFDRVEANKLESRTLAITRDLLLPKLMSGEIRVKDAEEIAESAA